MSRSSHSHSSSQQGLHGNNTGLHFLLLLPFVNGGEKASLGGDDSAGIAVEHDLGSVHVDPSKKDVVDMLFDTLKP